MSDDRNEGGLFSNDYETPKRENPYLKKNRVKAKSEKKAQEERISLEKEESSSVANADKPDSRRKGNSADTEGYTINAPSRIGCLSTSSSSPPLPRSWWC